MLYKHKNLDHRLYFECGMTPEEDIMVYDLRNQITSIVVPEEIELIEDDYPGYLMEVFEEFIDHLPNKNKFVPDMDFQIEIEDSEEERICIQLGKYLPKEERVWDINFKTAKELGLKPEDARKLLVRYEAAVKLLTPLLSHCENFPYKDDTYDEPKDEGDYNSDEEEAIEDEAFQEAEEFDL